MTDTSNFTPEMLAELERAYASGTRRLTYDGKTIEYQTLSDMERAINTIRRNLNKQAGISKSRRVHLRSKRGI